MSEEIQKIKDFLFLKRDSVQRTIDDEKSTLIAILIFAVTIILAGIQPIVTINAFSWMSDWMGAYFLYTPPSFIKITLNMISGMISPVIAVILSFYIGNAIKGEAASLKHVFRAVGYSMANQIPLLQMN